MVKREKLYIQQARIEKEGYEPIRVKRYHRGKIYVHAYYRRGKPLEERVRPEKPKERALTNYSNLIPKFFNRVRGYCYCHISGVRGDPKSGVMDTHFCRFLIEPTASQTDALTQFKDLHDLNYPNHDLLQVSGFNAFRYLKPKGEMPYE